LAASFSAGPGTAACVDALQQLAAADRGIWIEPTHLLDASKASGGLAAAAVQLEEQMMYRGGLLDNASPEKGFVGGFSPDLVVDMVVDVYALGLAQSSVTGVGLFDFSIADHSRRPAQTADPQVKGVLRHARHPCCFPDARVG
jgi:hypothetical protein